MAKAKGKSVSGAGVGGIDVLDSRPRDVWMIELVRFFVGLDLGQRCDYSALVAVEVADLILDELDYVTYERRRERRMRVRLVQRIALGTPYPDVVELVRRVVRDKELAGRCTLVVDATGVGAPVMDMLRRADLGCPIEGVVLTGGEQGVARRRAVAGAEAGPDLRAAGDAGETGAGDIAASGVGAGVDEGAGGDGGAGARVGAWRAGEHDDLGDGGGAGLSGGRGCGRPPVWGTRSLGPCRERNQVERQKSKGKSRKFFGRKRGGSVYHPSRNPPRCCSNTSKEF